MSKIISTKETKQASRLSIKRIAIIVIAVIVLGLVAFGIYWQLSSTKQKSDVTSKVDTSLPVEQQSQQLISQGDYDGAQKLLTSKAATADEAAKIDTYRQMATNALNTKKYDDAKAYGEKVESIKPTSTSAALLGHVYEATGDKQRAADYYRKAIDRLDKSVPSYDMQRSDLERYIKGLGL